MLASGERLNEVKAGDVVLEGDGYMRVYMKATNGVWFEFILSPNNLSWVTEPKRDPFIATNNKYVLNVKDLLVSIREEMRETST
jgi:hypothetical protein